MSYWELWNNYSKLRENWDESRSIISGLVDFFNQKSDIEKDYANGLSRLTRSSLFTKGKNTIEPSLQRLQTFCSQQLESLQALISQQQTDLIPCLKELLFMQDEIINSKIKYAKDFENEVRKHEDTIKKTKKAYFDLFQNPSPSKKEKDLSEKYEQAVEEANKFLEFYEETMKPIFGIYQSQDEAKYKTIQDTLNKLVVFQMSFVRSLQYELEIFTVSINAINPATETKKFISDNLSKPFKPFQIELPPKRIINESTFISKASADILKKVLKKCWKGAIITENDQKNFIESVTSLEGRKMIINQLKEKKSNNEVLLTSRIFSQLCSLMNLVLDKVHEFQDDYCAKQVLFVSQSFYEETLTQKTFLFQVLSTHPLWEEFKVWSKMIITAVEIEIENDSRLGSEEADSLVQIVKIGAVLANKIEIYVKEMKNFMVEDSVKEKTLKFIQEYYGFTSLLQLKARKSV